MIKLSQTIKWNGGDWAICPKCGNLVCISQVDASVSYNAFGDSDYDEMSFHHNMYDNIMGDNIPSFIDKNPVSYDMIIHSDTSYKRTNVIDNLFPVYCHCTKPTTPMRYIGNSVRTALSFISLGYNVLDIYAGQGKYSYLKIKLGPMDKKRFDFLKFIIAEHNKVDDVNNNDKRISYRGARGEIYGKIEYILNQDMISTICLLKDSNIYHFLPLERYREFGESGIICPIPSDFDSVYHELYKNAIEMKDDVLDALVFEFGPKVFQIQTIMKGEVSNLV